MSSITQAPLITSPIQNVVIETYIGTGSDGPIPHTFLKVTDSNGNVTYVGFAPQRIRPDAVLESGDTFHYIIQEHLLGNGTTGISE